MYKILVLHAHPDDELVWMGGTLIKYKDILEVDFVCLTFPFNKPRIAGFMNLDRYFNAKRMICLGFEDDPAVYREGKDFFFDDSWMEGIDFSRYDLVFSHNQKGEYHHPHHLYLNFTLRKFDIPFISWGHVGERDFSIHLEPQHKEEKIKIISDLYILEYDRVLKGFAHLWTQDENFVIHGCDKKLVAEIFSRETQK